ncbi:aminotransferase class V-fold PLP-dependent enzyme [Shewanella marina]|uniref:aminotransferase class V-fold PLP-dependent enzyme n=1 Tax=Shewanella marina TaxID=487319 RepID=UPI000470598C|nr:aminotransferase class V-fold PLP-dependent enzyme [Shewanella marina]
MVTTDFVLPNQGCYLLNHSVGRPLANAQQYLQQHFWQPWQQQAVEPWAQWLTPIDCFTQQLALLFNAQAQDFCPQTNLSSGLTKLLMSREDLTGSGRVILMSEQDFPSMGFVVQRALPNAEIRYIENQLDCSDINVWQQHIDEQVDLVFISHGYSNSGQLAPVAEIIKAAKQYGCLTLVDVAQTAGVIEVDLAELAPDFLIGSSVKWLCGGPGAAYLWVNPLQLTQCQPVDVGWFSHDNPFEFDIHQFRFNQTALRFWGGTPSVMPFMLAANSIDYVNQYGVTQVRQHNLQLQQVVQQQLADYIRSPTHAQYHTGTLILDFAADNQLQLQRLTAAGIAVDVRSRGLRVSPHIYNSVADMQCLVDCIVRG